MAADLPEPALTRAQGITAAVRDWGSRLYGFIRRRVSSDEDAQDILQDVWQQLSAQPEIEAISQLSAWLHEVARNKIIDRSRKPRETLVDDHFPEDEDGGSLPLDQFLVSDDTPEGQYMNRLFWDELSDALDALPPEQRRVFVENELEGRPLRELAAESGESIKTLISRKGYAVQALRKRLARLHQEFLDLSESTR
jgi:RNA polymerase sigma factor (sigma-70 family)